MKKLSIWISQKTKWWLVLTSLLVFLGFMIFVLPEEATRAENYSGEIGSPDTSFYYTRDKLYKMAESYGPEGRSAYIRARWSFDLVFPFVYTFFLTTTMSWVFQKVNLRGLFWDYINLLPIIGMVFDFLENAAASFVMARFPNQDFVISHLSGIFTSIKWIFIGSSFLILIAGFILLIWRRFHKTITLP